MMGLSWWIWTNWEVFTDWIGWAPDTRIYATPDDVQ